MIVVIQCAATKPPSRTWKSERQPRYSAGMTQADQIRRFALDRYIVPARIRNDAEIVIRAGDVHSEMGLVNAMLAVCSAIRSRKFEEVSGATIVRRSGPTNGANVYFHLRLTADSRPARRLVF